ncbi:MAG: hypothetical protein AABW80_00325 [Nanoarchaeota archaeon]
MVEIFGNKHAFWQALLFTIIIFGFGVILGFFLEDSRSDDVNTKLLTSEINVIDGQLRNRILVDYNVSCDIAMESTFNFADDIYSQALELEKYDAASTFTDTLTVLHKRYDILRTLLWVEAQSIRNKCDGKFHTVVYLYEYNTEDVERKAQQIFFSRLLGELKANNPKEILLIPIAANMNISSIDLIVDHYKIGKLPAILIDEREIVDRVLSEEELEKIVFRQ